MCLFGAKGYLLACKIRRFAVEYLFSSVLMVGHDLGKAYVLDCYEALHKTGLNYIIADINQFIEARQSK